VGCLTGDFVPLPRDIEHSFTVTSRTEAKVLVVIGPPRFDAHVAQRGIPSLVSRRAFAVIALRHVTNGTFRAKVIAVAVWAIARDPGSRRKQRDLQRVAAGLIRYLKTCGAD
jgi:hypothetical protein